MAEDTDYTEEEGADAVTQTLANIEAYAAAIHEQGQQNIKLQKAAIEQMKAQHTTVLMLTESALATNKLLQAFVIFLGVALLLFVVFYGIGCALSGQFAVMLLPVAVGIVFLVAMGVSRSAARYLAAVRAVLASMLPRQ